MKYLLSFIFIAAFISFGWSQPNMPKEEADSLWGVWEDKSLPNKSRLKAIHLYAWNGYLFNKPDSGFYFAQLEYEFAKETGEKIFMAYALNTQGISYDLRSNYSVAIKYYSQSLKMYEELGDKKGMARSLNNIGIAYKKKVDFTKAIDYYTKSLKINEELGDKSGMARSLNNIGVIIYQNQRDYVKALEYYEQSLELKKEIGDKKGIAGILNNIGSIYRNQGDYSKARNYYAQSLKIDREIGNKSGVAMSLSHLGIIYENQGDYTKARDYYTQSLKIEKEIGDKLGAATSLNNIGYSYSREDNYPMALDFLIQSLEISEEIGDKIGSAITINNIAKIYKDQNKYAKALNFSSRSLSIALKSGAPKWVKYASNTLYQTHILSNNLDSAKIYLSRIHYLLNSSLETNFFSLPEKEKQLYFSTMESDFGLYHDFALNFQSQFDNLTDTSYNIALQNKGLTLKSSTAMRQAIQSSGDTMLINEYEDWLTLKKKIANTSTTDSTYKKLTNQAGEMERNLVKNSTVFSDFDKVKNLHWQDVQAGLKENEAAIEFVNFKSEVDTANPIIYAALIIKKESKHPEMVKLCNEAELKEILGVFQGNNLDFVNSVYGSKEKVQTEIYEKVWKPMEESLEGVKDIYLSPSGLLHKVAFHAIVKDQNTYLCDVYNLQQQSSTGKIALPDEVAFNNSKTFLMLGGVKYNTDTTANEVWSYLPGTLEETDNIKSYLQKKKFNITHLTGLDASEEKLKEQAPKSNILHVSTHGFFFPDPKKVREEMEDNSVYYGDVAFRGNDIDPDKLQRSTRYADWTFVKNKNPLMRSGLALANANDVWQRPALAEGEDGVLTANEVSTIDLRNTELVVLSACETGLGDIKGSEGVYGLQRAFKIAGAKYLIMSLWQVPDKETAEFMGLFYEQLIKFEDIREAFSKTQQSMRKKYDPYYWAAFVLVE